MIPELDKVNKLVLKCHYPPGSVVPSPLIARPPPAKKQTSEKPKSSGPTLIPPLHTKEARASLMRLRQMLEEGGLTFVFAYTKNTTHKGIPECTSTFIFVRDDRYPRQDKRQLIAEYDKFVKGFTWNIDGYLDDEDETFRIHCRWPKCEHKTMLENQNARAVA